MAFDGIVVAGLVKELQTELTGAKINKIAQPEKDALLFTCKGTNGQTRLFVSASASLPLCYLTKENKPSPLTAPNFCMLLRKHIANGRIIEVQQPGLERIIQFKIQHLNDLGDVCYKYLIVELMGKHSNIIFCDENFLILDSIKHISAQISSVREVLPGKDYFIPNTTGKTDPLALAPQEIFQIIKDKPTTCGKALYGSFVGISPLMANECCYRCGMDADAPIQSYDEDTLLHLATQFSFFLEDVKNGDFQPVLYYKQTEPMEFAAFPLQQFADYEAREAASISEILQTYYAEKEAFSRIRQKSTDLRRVIHTALERTNRKLDLQRKQLKDTEKREKYKLYGELLNTYGYQCPEGAKSYEVLNYYNNEMVKIPLDDTLSPIDNAKKYFQRYNKLKRTYEALTVQIAESEAEQQHLESISASMDIAENESDLVPIRRELVESGYIKKKSFEKKTALKSKPLHFVTSEGFHIYVGKNNYQNDELTFKVANGGDWWFHAKKIPGSHVILRTEGKEIPDQVFEKAAALAAYYSKGGDNDKIEIDYLERKNVKKPSGAAPGFVVYYTNFSMSISPSLEGVTQVKE